MHINYSTRSLAKTDPVEKPDLQALENPDALRKLAQAIEDPDRRALALAKLVEMSSESSQPFKDDGFEREP